jgi:hypothetical protein
VRLKERKKLSELSPLLKGEHLKTMRFKGSCETNHRGELSF